mgnify:CR=1 FL=1
MLAWLCIRAGDTDGAGELMWLVVQLVGAVRAGMAVHIRADGAASAITCAEGTDDAGALTWPVMQLVGAVRAGMAVHTRADGAAGAITCAGGIDGGGVDIQAVW